MKSKLEAALRRHVLNPEEQKQLSRLIISRFPGPHAPKRHLFVTNPFAKIRREVRFDDSLRRFDFAFPTLMIAIEIQGGIFGQSRRSRAGHASKSGITRDYKKLADAQLLGWRVLWLTPDDVTVNWRSHTLPMIADHIVERLRNS